MAYVLAPAAIQIQKCANCPAQLSFETVVLKGLAQDGGLFLPHEIPNASKWVSYLAAPNFETARR